MKELWWVLIIKATRLFYDKKITGLYYRHLLKCLRMSFFVSARVVTNLASFQMDRGKQCDGSSTIVNMSGRIRRFITCEGFKKGVSPKSRETIALFGHFNVGELCLGGERVGLKPLQQRPVISATGVDVLKRWKGSNYIFLTCIEAVKYLFKTAYFPKTELTLHYHLLRTHLTEWSNIITIYQ